MEYSYSFTEEEYSYYIKQELEKNKKYINYKFLNRVEKTQKVALVVLMICIYLMTLIIMVMERVDLIISAIISALVTILAYFLIKKIKSKFTNYSSDHSYKSVYEFNSKERGRKRVVLEGPFLRYYLENEITVINCNLIDKIDKNEMFLIISHLDLSILIPLRVLNSYNEEEKFISKINSYKDNDCNSIYESFDGISSEKIYIDDSDIKTIINYTIYNKKFRSKIFKILLPIMFIEILEIVLMYLLLYMLELKTINIILILIILLIITNFIILPKFIKKIFRKIFNSEKRDNSGYRIYINESGIYNLKDKLLTGSTWKEGLILDKYHENYFLVDNFRVIAYIPTKAFKNMKDMEVFINKLKNYLKK